VESVADNAESAPPKSLGQKLAAERERQGLSRSDVAQRLHMSAYQIEAIETGDYSRLPKGTFLRGFVRNYAKVLGLAPDALLALLTEAPSAEKKPGIVVPTQNIRFDPIGERLANPYVKAATIAAVVIAIAFAAMYWWLFIRGTPPDSPARKALTETPVAAPASDGVASAPLVVPVPAMAEPARGEARKGDALKADGAKAPPSLSASAMGEGKPDGSVLKFRFKGASWVEIRDAKGKILLSKLNPAGSETEVVGKPPLNVIVGNAPEVEVVYNDRPFDLEPHTKVAVARFKVE
jgi:cytoskeleton protein RodZ